MLKALPEGSRATSDTSFRLCFESSREFCFERLLSKPDFKLQLFRNRNADHLMEVRCSKKLALGLQKVHLWMTLKNVDQ